MYGTKNTSKGANKGAQGQDLKDKVKVSAEKVENKVEGSKETDVKELIEKDPESKKAYNEISQKVNEKEDKQKEAEARKEIPNSKTELVETTNNGEKVTIGITKDENTGSNKNTVKEDKKEEPVKELVSENGTKTTIDVNSVVDVPAQEKAPEVKAEENKKAEEKTTNGIASMFPEETEEDSAKEFSKQVETEIKEEAPVVEDKKEVTKEVLPVVESTEEETAKVVAEEKTVEPTKEAKKAEVVEAKKEVKQQNKITEEKVEVVTEERFALDDTFKVANRDQDIIFNVTSGVATSVENSDEQIKVTIINGGKQIKVENQFKDFDANQISFKVNGETVFVSFK